MRLSQVRAEFRKMDGWTLLSIRDSNGLLGTTLRYTRPEFDDVAKVFVPADIPIEKRMVAASLQKLLERGPPPARA